MDTNKPSETEFDALVERAQEWEKRRAKEVSNLASKKITSKALKQKQPWWEKPYADYKHMLETTPQIKPKAPKNQEKLVHQILEIREANAQDVGTVGYTSPIFILATMPHAEPQDEHGKKLAVFTRTNGDYRLTIQGDPDIGVPYGSLPRLILVWLISEAVRTQNKEVFLGNSLSAFMRELGIEPVTGRNSTVKNMRNQLARLISCRITCKGYRPGEKHHTDHLSDYEQITPIRKAFLWWHPKKDLEPSLFNSSVVLSEDFFQEIIKRPVPLDMRALRALKGSPMALDIYSWLTYSMYSLRQEAEVPWKKLHIQFGADYKRLVDFKVNFKKHLADVLLVYNEVKVMPEKGGIVLLPSHPHVRIVSKRPTKKLPPNGCS